MPVGESFRAASLVIDAFVPPADMRLLQYRCVAAVLNHLALQRAPFRAQVGEMFRAASLVNDAVVDLDGVRLLRYHGDPDMALPDPRFHQNINGLLNITAPQAWPSLVPSTLKQSCKWSEFLCKN